MTDRRQESYAVRLEAAEMARSRQHPQHEANGDEQRYASEQYFMSFTKGLPHNPDTGLLQEPNDFVEFRRAIDDGFVDAFSDRVRHGAKYTVINNTVKKEPDEALAKDFRQWEAPTAGVVYELQGPDAQAVTMPPAPALLNDRGEVNPELVFEMAEVYELAVLRDVPFNNFEAGKETGDINQALTRLNALAYIGDLAEGQEGRPRKVNSTGALDAQTLFRGSSPGVEVGPYLSQFLLMGSPDINGACGVKDGKIAYGVLQIDQKVPIAEPKKDFMTELPKYVDVQRGIAQERESYSLTGGRVARRFISTPRDLATYVHYDALYEAYLNACIILLGMNTPFDPSMDHLSGVGAAASSITTRRNAGGFALFGGPHILNLVTEVATRALKAVRFQKFNNHIRLRPEALAARIELSRLADDSNWCNDHRVPESIKTHMADFREALKANGENEGTLGAVKELGYGYGNYLLPMAFPEGSPMHPAYGAGHATVAGACVTILKAFFDTNTVLVERKKESPKANECAKEIIFSHYRKGDTAIALRAPKLTSAPDAPLEALPAKQRLTLEGELNKLAANISIGRDMAGVHYFSDYYDSLRMGEKIAIGILEEQALTYTTDPCVLSVPTFDGGVVRIGRR